MPRPITARLMSDGFVRRSLRLILSLIFLLASGLAASRNARMAINAESLKAPYFWAAFVLQGEWHE